MVITKTKRHVLQIDTELGVLESHERSPSIQTEQSEERERERKGVQGKSKWKKLNKDVEKNMSFNVFGWEMILPDEQTVVTSCMQFTKTRQKRRLPMASWSTEIWTVCVCHRVLQNRNRGEKGSRKNVNQIPRLAKCTHIYS